MAERTISTRLVLQGEKEYRNQIAQINREYKALDSQLKLVESQFKGQENTLAALTAKNKALNDVMAKQAEKLKAENDAIERNKRYQREAASAAEKTRAKLEELNRSTSDADKETEEYHQEIERLKKELESSERAEAKAQEAIERHTAASNNAKIKLNTLNAELRSNQKYLAEAQSSADGCATSIDEMGREAKDTTGQFEEMGDKGGKAVDALASTLAAAGVVATLKEIADGIHACLDASVEFESAMAGVAKTTDMSGEELLAMGEQIKQLSERIPMTTTELAQIAEVGGQLGIAKEDLIAFTEVMAGLGVATNMTSEEAATMLAQLSAITGMDASLYENLGSAIVELGNNFATNEKKITDMAQTVAAAGTNAGMSVPDILALSAAVTSLGIESGTGGTNMSKLIGDMQMAVETGEDLELWAKAAGMSAKEFAQLWGQDATAALVAFIQGLGSTEESALQTLSSLGETDARLVRMVTSLNNAEKANGTMSRALAQSDSAWKMSTALANEAATKYETTASKQQILVNSTNNLKIAIGDQLKPALNSFLEVGTDAVQWAEDFIRANEGIVPSVTALVAALGTFTGVTVGISAATKAVKLLNAALAANPAAMVAGAVLALVAAVATYVATTQTASEEVQALNTAQQNLNTAMENAETAYKSSVTEIEAQATLVGKLCDELDDLAGKSSLTAEEQDRQRLIVSQLNEIMPGLNVTIDEQTGKLNTSTEAIKKQTEAWKQNQIALALAEQRQALSKAAADATIELTKAELARESKLKEITELENEHGRAQERIAAAAGGTLEWYRNLSEAQQQATADNIAANEQDENRRKQLEADAKTIRDYTENVETLNQEVEDMEEPYKAVSKAVDEANNKLEEFEEVEKRLVETTDEMPKAAEETAKAVKVQADAYKPLMDKLTEMNELQKKIGEETKSQVESVVGGFEEIVPPAEKSVEDTIAALNSQIVYMDNFGSLVQRALAMGYKASLVAELSDGSEKSSAILQGMVDANAEEVAAMNTAWDGKLTQSAELTEELTNAKLAADEGFAALVDEAVAAANDLNQAELAQAAGEATVQGLLNGLDSKLGEVSATVARYNALISQLGNVSAPRIPKKNSRENWSSHASGIDYVPRDGYMAELHEGERVLTATAARAQRAMDYVNYGAVRRFERMRGAGSSTNTNVEIHVHMQGGSKNDGEKIANELARRLRYKGVIPS